MSERSKERWPNETMQQWVARTQDKPRELIEEALQNEDHADDFFERLTINTEWNDVEWLAKLRISIKGA